jgi:hypothetical protein
LSRTESTTNSFTIPNTETICSQDTLGKICSRMFWMFTNTCFMCKPRNDCF